MKKRHAESVKGRLAYLILTPFLFVGVAILVTIQLFVLIGLPSSRKKGKPGQRR